MSVRARLNKIFNKPILFTFIPLVNKVITLVKRKTATSTIWNAQYKRFELRENGQLIQVDVLPYWGCTKQYLRDAVNRINLVGIELGKSDTVVDIGSGTGTEAVIFSELVGESGKVYAIEAHPETYCSLELLVQKGEHRNILPFHLAIGNTEGTVRMDDLADHEKNAVSFDGVSSNSGLSVQMVTLDQFVAKNNITQIDFLKVNIEGSESLMIEGMKESIGIVRNAAISCHDFLNHDSSKPIMKKVKLFFEKNGFNVNHYPKEHPVMNSWIYMTRV